MSDAAAPAGTTTLDVWLTDHPIPDFNAPVKAAAETFERAHPGYRIRIREIGYRDLPAAVAEAVAAGNPPDIAEYYFPAGQVALDTRAADGSELFVPLERAIGDRTKILGEPVVLDDIVPVVRDYYSRGGELVSMPTMVSTAILFANQGLLRRAGIDRLPSTWRELTDACAAVAALPDGPAHGIAWPNHGWLIQMELAAQGGLLSNSGNGRSGRSTRVTLDSPEIVAYARWWQSLHQSGHYLYTGEPRDFWGAMEAFTRQETAFVITSSATGPFLTDLAGKAGFELATGALPRNEDAPYAGRSLGGQSMFLAAGLPKEKEDGALAFTQHLLNPDHAVRRLHAGSLPVMQPAWEQVLADGWADREPGFRVAAEQVMASDRTPAATGALLGDINGINEELTSAMHDILLSGADPAARLRTATERAQARLDRYNEACLAYPPVTPEALQAG
ncbi:extracellular solute-binding protein [Amycolatopsis sp. NPDC051045]|uniref:extracellular solute-binding protein n=1 Tax=Amycolatopsis sp. NPDC051045 TaxID=3156922 RepID=UPI00344A54BF